MRRDIAGDASAISREKKKRAKCQSEYLAELPLHSVRLAMKINLWENTIYDPYGFNAAVMLKCGNNVVHSRIEKCFTRFAQEAFFKVDFVDYFTPLETNLVNFCSKPKQYFLLINPTKIFLYLKSNFKVR